MEGRPPVHNRDRLQQLHSVVRALDRRRVGVHVEMASFSDEVFFKGEE